jgi:malonyl-CoA/methylmalonyl-CoA synthetase
VRRPQACDCSSPDPRRSWPKRIAISQSGPGAAVSEADIIRAVKTRLAGYKIPKRILFLDDLPRNAMGKVQKNALRSTYAALYLGE